MLSKNEYISNGKTVRYQVTFPFVNRDTVSVEVGGTPVNFKFLNDGMIELENIPTARDVIQIKRKIDISKIYHSYVKGEVLDADEINSNKFQLILALQEIVETELDSLDKSEDGTMYLKIDMGGNQIIDLANATDDLDAVNYGQLIEMVQSKGLVSQAGFDIGHTIISARTDQSTRLVDNIQEWIPRNTEQQLIKTDYPELATMYPETPGGIVSIDDNIRYANYPRNPFAPYIDVVTGDVYYVQVGAYTSLYKIDNVGTETLLNTFSGSFTVLYTCAHDDIVIVSGNTGGFFLRYSLDGGATWGAPSISGPSFTNQTVDIIHINGRFITYSSISNLLLHSIDGVNWTSVSMTGIGIDFSKMQASNSLTPAIGKGRWTTDGTDFIVTSYTTGSAQKQVTYRINSDVTIATEINYTPSTSIQRTDTNGCYQGLNGKIHNKKVTTITDGFIQHSDDFGATVTREFDLKTLVPGLTGFQNLSKIGDIPLATCVESGVGSYIIKSDDDWVTGEVIGFTSDYTDGFGNKIHSSYCTDDIPDNKLYQDFQNNHFMDYDIIVGSNLTFDMPAISPPSEGSGGLEQLSILKKGVNNGLSINGMDYNSANNSIYTVESYGSSDPSKVYKNGLEVYTISSTRKRSNVYSEGNFGLISSPNQGLFYTTDDFNIVTQCTINSGPTFSSTVVNSFAYINNKYITLFTGNSSETTLYLMVSDDGITWDSIYLNALGWSKGSDLTFQFYGSDLIEFKNGRYYFYPKVSPSNLSGKVFSLDQNFSDYQSTPIIKNNSTTYYTRIASDGICVGHDTASKDLIISTDFGQTISNRSLSDIGSEILKSFNPSPNMTGAYTLYDGKYIFMFHTSSETVFFETDNELQNVSIIETFPLTEGFTNFSTTFSFRGFRSKQISGTEGFFILNNSQSVPIAMKIGQGSLTQHKYYTKGK